MLALKPVFEIYFSQISAGLTGPLLQWKYEQRVVKKYKTSRKEPGLLSHFTLHISLLSSQKQHTMENASSFSSPAPSFPSSPSSSVPSHVQEWLWEIQEASTNEHTRSCCASCRVHFNAVEAEVIHSRVAQRSKGSADDETSGKKFGRDMFQSKKAHRVACLLASASLLISLTSNGIETGEAPRTPRADEDFNQAYSQGEME